VQANLKAKNSSMFEGKRKQERRTEAGKGVREKTKAGGV